MQLGSFRLTKRIASQFKSIFITTICAFAFSIPAEPAQKIVKVGVYEDFPMVFVEQGEAKGLYIDLLKEIAQHEGWRLQYVHGTWPEVYRKTLKGEIDILTSIARAEERRPYFDFNTVPVEISYGRLVIRQNAKLTSLRELDKIRVGLMRDDINAFELKKRAHELNISPIWQYYDNYTEMLLAVSRGEIEAAAINNLYARHELESFGLKYADTPYAPVMLTFAVAKGKNPELLQTIDHYMMNWVADPDSIYYKSRERWLRAHFKPILPRWVKPTVLALASAIVLSLLWLFTLRRLVTQRTAELASAKKELTQTVSSLKELQTHLEAIIDAVPDGMITFSSAGQITGAFGKLPKPLEKLEIGQHLVDALPPDLSALTLKETEKALKISAPRTFCTKLVHYGEFYFYECRICPISDTPDSPSLLMLVRDISAQERLRENVKTIDARFEAFANAMPDLGFILNTDGDYVAVFGAREDLFVRPPQELIGKNIKDVLPPNVSEQIMRGIANALATELTASVEYCLDVPAGLRYFEAHIAAIKDSSLNDTVAIVSRDITSRIEAEKAIRQLAFYDMLTSLPNRKLFLDRLQQAMSQCSRNGATLAVILLDLDGFKSVNDTLGHDAGDELLKIVSQRLKKNLRASDTVARLGGDEFAILQTMVRNPDDVAVFCEKVIQAIRTPIRLRERDVTVDASLGITLFDNKDQNLKPEEIVRQADLAMYSAKEKGKGGFCFYDSNLSEEFVNQVQLLQELRTAVSEQTFELHYQPQVDLATGEIVTLEALIRWQHGDSLIRPGQFISLAKQTGIIHDIDRLVIKQTVAQLAAWQPLLKKPIVIAVNISADEVQAQEFSEFVLETLKTHNVDPKYLELEVTEAIFIGDIDASAENIGVLSGAGVHLSIDDFGAGYSSLQYVKRFPIQKLKIDMDFVHALPFSVVDQKIVRSILGLAQSLNFTSVAEGIENEQQLKVLLEMGCQLGQGFLFAKPAPANQIEPLLVQGYIKFPLLSS